MCTMYSVHCTLYIQYGKYSVKITHVFNIQESMVTAYYIVYTVYTVQCILYSDIV